MTGDKKSLTIKIKKLNDPFLFQIRAKPGRIAASAVYIFFFVSSFQVRVISNQSSAKCQCAMATFTGLTVLVALLAIGKFNALKFIRLVSRYTLYFFLINLRV